MRPLPSCYLIMAALLLAAAPAAFAVDGVVLINQATATSGLPGCPTTGALPIIICNPGSYRLSGNVTLSDPHLAAEAIEITASNVTLDLNGFTVAGPGSGFSFGIYTPNTASNVNVGNGTVSGFYEGVVLNGPGSVRGITAANNANVGIVANGTGLIEGCVVYGSGSFGIVADGPVNQVTNNTVLALGATALVVGNSSGYGLNSLLGTVTGGTSQGNNTCNGAKC